MHDPDVRSAVESVDHHARLVRFGERETHDRSPLGRGDLGLDVVVGEVYRILVGRARPPTGARTSSDRLLFIDLVASAYGHDGELPVVVDPRRGLVRLLQTSLKPLTACCKTVFLLFSFVMHL